MKYIKKFANNADYQQFIGGGGLYNPKSLSFNGY